MSCCFASVCRPCLPAQSLRKRWCGTLAARTRIVCCTTGTTECPGVHSHKHGCRTKVLKDGQRHGDSCELFIASAAFFYFLSDLSAIADPLDGSPGYSLGSYYVSLGLFVVTLPGLWSLIKRAPKSKIVRKVFEVDGPGRPGAMPLDQRARQVFSYFKKYNYEVAGTGDVIKFVGSVKASNSQAAALVLYTLVSLASCALVLSIAAPFGGNWWYLMTLISPAAGAYYLQNAERQEEVAVKMVTEDDESVTDIVIQGAEEEIERLRRELGLFEKGKVYVKGILEA